MIKYFLKKHLKSILIFNVIISVNFDSFAQKLNYYSCIMDRIDMTEMEKLRTFDNKGIIKSNKRYHPLSIAQFGVMAYYNFKESNDSIFYHKCVNQFNYFKDSNLIDFVFDGKGIGLPYNFNFWDLKAPWYSGMTQGYGISYLLRYYDLTHDEQALPIISKIAYVLLQRQEDGGTISTTKEGYTWIEEYPNSKKSPQVLNGYINGLIGLKEYVDFFPKDTMAKRILNETYLGLTNSLHFFDTNTWSHYNRAKKSLQNKYLRYQIYEMKHLYELFNDEIFDNQMRIWSVISHKKYINEKSKVYKFPNHNISVPIKLIDSNKLGIPIFQKTKVLALDSMPSSTSLTKKQLRKIKRKQKNSHLFHFVNDSFSKVDFIEILNNQINKETSISAYIINDKNKIEQIEINYQVRKKSLLVSFDEVDLSHLVLSLSFVESKKSSINKTSFNFYNTGLIKPPFFAHHKTKNYHLKKDTNYNISLDANFTDKFKIFFKSAKSAGELGKSKWQARHTTDGEFSPDVNGVFQFMVVFDYTSPLSSISNIKVNAINNSK